jgi:hypothetical protein
MNNKVWQSRRSSDEHLSLLDAACQWLGIGQGRTVEYIRLLREFRDEGKSSPPHILAYSESVEIVQLFELWEGRHMDFPGLRERLKDVLGKGPLLREHENVAASSNQARNDAFSLLIAGTLLKGGIPVVAVEGISVCPAACTSEADVTIKSDGGLLDIECKRPQTEKALSVRGREARRQIEKPSRGGRHGMIALDCSVFVRPPWKLLETDSPENAELHIWQTLETHAKPKLKLALSGSIVCCLLFARIPTMIRSFTPMGTPIFRPECIESWGIVENCHFAGSPCVIRWAKTRLPEAIFSAAPW